MGMIFNHGAFMDELRKRRGTVPADLYGDLMASLDAGLGNAPVKAQGEDPAWLVEARKYMGMKEIPGPQNNQTIIGWIKQLGGFFTDDETPWCGTFVAHCMMMAGQPVPKNWFRAKEWADWGKSTPARVGAVAVFGRKGGGHVAFVVGESESDLYVLGGNQSNMVNIMPIAKDRLIGMRWPLGLPLSQAQPTRMAGGAISRNEA